MFVFVLLLFESSGILTCEFCGSIGAQWWLACDVRRGFIGRTIHHSTWTCGAVLLEGRFSNKTGPHVSANNKTGPYVKVAVTGVYDA